LSSLTPSPVPAGKLRELAELHERRERYAHAATVREDPTPGALALRMDPMAIQTPALDVIDDCLVSVRDCIDGMFRRRRKLADLRREGYELRAAISGAVELVPPVGTDRLAIAMPPQEGKSTRVSRVNPLWLLRQFPGLRMGIVSYDGNIAGQFSFQIREDIKLHDGEAGEIDLGLRLVKDQKAMSRWMLTNGSTVYAIGIGGGLAGRPLDVLVIDDPVKDQKAADSEIMSAQAWVWWQTIARPRLAPWAPVIVVSTRWHEGDLIGRVVSKQEEDEAQGLEHYDRWEVVNIPAQADHDPAKGETDILGREPGEYMLSARGRTDDQWEATKAATGSRYWLALYQGRPAPAEGEVWKRTWWRRYAQPLWSLDSSGCYRIPGFEVWQSWDCAFRDTDSSDFVVGQVWAKRGADSYLVYQVWKRMGFIDTLASIRRVSSLFPQASRKLIEAKANGDAVIDSLKHEIPGIIPSTPYTSKVARATAVSPFIEAGNVHLPTSACATLDPEIAWDPEHLILEAVAFPNGRHDDQVDATSQYLQHAYLVGGEAVLSTPEGRINGRQQPERKLSPLQERLHRLGRASQ
jgi:predicted phage terminase large subunit-like protein